MQDPTQIWLTSQGQLLVSSEGGHFESASLLLVACADANKAGAAPLHRTYLTREATLAHLLLDARADLPRTTCGYALSG